MDKHLFFDQLADIFDVTEVNGDDILRDFEAWDSLAALSIIALANSKFGFTMKASDLKSLTTVNELYDYMTTKSAK